MNQPKIELSIIIVNYNVRYFLEQCLQSVVDASAEISTEIIVVDNQSKDSSCAMVAEKFPQVILIANTDNGGFSKANNQGVAIAKGKYVLILNPDTVIAEDTLTEILAFAKSKNNLGILGVKLIDGTGAFLPESKRGIPTPKISFNKLLGISSDKTGAYYATHLHQNESGVVEILVGAFMLMKRSIYLEVEGFDEAFFMYGEDIDLSYKIHNKGYQNYYFPKTKVIHYKGESTNRDVKYLKYFYGAMQIFYKKHFKLNVIYDFLMNFGIQFWYSLQYLKLSKKQPPQNKISQYIYMGMNNTLFSKLKEILPHAKGFQSTTIDKTISNEIDTIIFDNNYFTNKEIIHTMENLHLQKRKIHFRCVPKGCDFIIGSDNSVDNGKIIQLK